MPTNAYDNLVFVETDADGATVLPGNGNRRFWIEETRDGSLLLHPVGFDAKAQAAFDNDPELQAMLAQAMNSPTVHEDRRRRRSE